MHISRIQNVARYMDLECFNTPHYVLVWIYEDALEQLNEVAMIAWFVNPAAYIRYVP